MKQTIKESMRKIKEVYKTSSKQVAEAWAEYEKLGDEIVSTQSSRRLTPAGRNEKVRELRERQTALIKDMDAVRIDADMQAKKIRQDVEKTFYAYYHPSGTDVDLQKLKLIESGIMSDDELLHMAEGENLTMKRMIGKALEMEKPGRTLETRRAGRLLQVGTDNPHLAAIDALCNVGNYACGGAPLSGRGGAASFLKRFDELTDPIIESAPNVARVYGSNPLEVSFTTDAGEQ